MIVYQVLADLVVAAHFSYVAFVIFGQIAILYGVFWQRSWARNLYFRWLHLIGNRAGSVTILARRDMPLDGSGDLPSRAGEASYPGDFIGYWAGRLLFYEGPAWVFVVAYTAFGASVLATFVLAPPRHR